MGRMQREKGKRFERAIATLLRQRWPSAVVRRASQAERADNPDVFVEGGPPLLARLWLELQDARSPTPMAKLEQAERDADWWWNHGPSTRTERLPVVVWHRIGERTTWATLRLSTLDAIRGTLGGNHAAVVTLELEQLLELIVDETPLARSAA